MLEDEAKRSRSEARRRGGVKVDDVSRIFAAGSSFVSRNLKLKILIDDSKIENAAMERANVPSLDCHGMETIDNTARDEVRAMMVDR